MSRSHRPSTREQNGSLTSEPDSMNRPAPGAQSKASKGERLQSKPATGERNRSSRSTQKHSINKEKGPDTSTPVKSETEAQRQQQHAPWPGDPILSVGVRRSLADELDATQTSADSSVSASADAVRRVNQAAQAMTAAGGPYSPAVSSIHQDSTASTFSVSTGTGKRSFVSEYENGTIQAQRHELQMLMTELKDRDKELNDMVKAHHQQLLGWEEDRQRILNLEQRNTVLEAEAKRKNDQVRALVARLKTMESVQQTKQTALEHSQSQLSQLTEQLSQTQLKLKDTQEKGRQMSGMVKELSNTLGKLESKEQEMLSLLKLKDQDLTAASAHLSELSTKLKSMDAKVKEGQRAENEAQRVAAEWREKYTEIKNVTDKLKSDLNRSQLEEEESRLEVDRAKREQERLRKQILNMSDREKRQEQLINSQRLKQERTDSELNSIRQLYERQQRDMSLLQLNLDSARDMISKHSDCCQDTSNISLLLQSPTSGRTVAYYTGDNTVTLPATPRPDSVQSAGTALSVSTSSQPASNVVTVPNAGTTGGPVQGPMSPLDTDRRSPHMAAVGPGHHQHTNTPTTNSNKADTLSVSKNSYSYSQNSSDQNKQPENSASYNQNNSENPTSYNQRGGSMEISEVQGQQRAGRSGIPVMVHQGAGVHNGAGSAQAGVVQTRAQHSAVTPRPASAIPQYRGRSLERNTSGQGRSARSESGERQVEAGYRSISGYTSSSNSGTVEKRYYQRQTQSLQYQQQPQQNQQQQLQYQQQHQQQDAQGEVMQSVETQLKQLQAFSRQLQQHDDAQDRPGGSSIRRPTTPPPPPPVNNQAGLTEFRTPPRRLTNTSINQRTPSPRTPSHSGSPAAATGDIESLRGAGLEDSVNADYPEQNGLSAAVAAEDTMTEGSWVLEGPQDTSIEWTGPPDTSAGWTGTGGSVNAGSYTEHHSHSSMPESPTSKLHRLLTESRQMVQSLERSTYPPFFTQEPLSPIKPDGEEEEEEN